MKQKIFLSILFSFLFSFGLGQGAEAVKSLKGEPGSPMEAIQKLDTLLNSYIINAKDEKDLQYNQELKKKIVNGTFDVRELCRLALDKHWQTRSEKERVAFVDLMTRLLERKAIFSKEQNLGADGSKGKGKYAVVYTESRFLDPRKTKALVLSYIDIPSEALKVELDYKLKQAGTEWKIYDVIVDGASLLNNYRYQFDKIISTDGYDDLLRRMQSKLAELEAASQL